MPDKAQALKKALEDGINVLKETYGDDYDRALVTQNIPLLLEVMWPSIESYNDHHVVHTFNERFLARFPNHVLANYGPTVFDYVVGNVQTAVVNEVISVLECHLDLISDAQASPKLSHATEKRDWDVAAAHTKELISEIKQYRARGGRGNPQSNTGSHPVQETDE